MQSNTKEYRIEWSSTRITTTSWETEENLKMHPTQSKHNQLLIENYENENISSKIRRHSSRDIKTASTNKIELLKMITTPKTKSNQQAAGTHRYKAFFKFVLDKCNNDLEQAILMVTSFKGCGARENR